MNIRLATEMDVPELVSLGREFAETQTDFRYNIASVTETLVSIVSGAGAVFVSERSGCITGAIALIKFPLYISGELVASELCWWVKPEHRNGTDGIRLIIEGEKWAREAGCTRISMISLESSMPDKVNRLYVRRGYKKVETTYAKEL